ncbi:MAG: hypothetical protein AVDCRST_MAG77-1347 [uncultured Chloroflexi bacterium]|uniref:PDZ domain-containing protein n=1 Tax=uncultured Chloroflexota bacterium TaxID=166587 RepID=A0A6J4I1J3_9CHLR|nr:MAG: hypothetical protein AVDCRST_MAG77-1347 [uncultured Chloroflexota bacterium]
MGLGIVARRVCRWWCVALPVVWLGVAAAAWDAVALAGDSGVRVLPVTRQGLRVVRVVPGGQAQAAGLDAGSSFIVGVEGLISRDERELWRALVSRPVGRPVTLNVQGSASGGTGTGLGRSRETQVSVAPRLDTRSTAAFLAAITLAGAAAIAAPLAAVVRGYRSWGAVPLVTHGAAGAGLPVARIWAEAGAAPWELAPPVVALAVVASVSLPCVLLLDTRLRRVPTTAAVVAAGVGLVCLLAPVAAPLSDDTTLLGIEAAGYALLAGPSLVLARRTATHA